MCLRQAQGDFDFNCAYFLKESVYAYDFGIVKIHMHRKKGNAKLNLD